MDPKVYLAKFSGLGKYGRSSHARAVMLAEAGFSPPVAGIENGFLVTHFIPGRPISLGGVDESLLKIIATYISFLKKHFPTERGVSLAQLKEMIRLNVLEGLGKKCLFKLEHSGLLKIENVDDPVAVDARMLPQEWIKVSGGYLKTDSVHHHDDHFFPGGQDIAWDIAGCQVELGLSRSQIQYLIKAYCHLTKDETLANRLPFHVVAYLAYRLGYASLAADTLGDTNDGRRFQHLMGLYTKLIKICTRSG